MGALLVVACDRDQPAVRSSSLACIAQVAGTLRFALHPWAVELLQVVEAAMEGESDAEARSAACYLLTTLLASLGPEAIVVLPAAQLASLHRRLRFLRDGEPSDSQLHAHASSALEQMGKLGKALAKGFSEGEGNHRTNQVLMIDGLKLPSPSGSEVRMPGGPRPLIEEIGATLGLDRGLDGASLGLDDRTEV